MTNQKGQTLIEAFLVLEALIASVSALVILIYFIYARQVSYYALAKNNLCLERLNISKHVCNRNLKTRLNQLLYFKNNLHVNSRQTSSFNKSSVSFKFRTKKIKWSKTLRKG